MATTPNSELTSQYVALTTRIGQIQNLIAKLQSELDDKLQAQEFLKDFAPAPKPAPSAAKILPVPPLINGKAADPAQVPAPATPAPVAAAAPVQPAISTK